MNEILFVLHVELEKGEPIDEKEILAEVERELEGLGYSAYLTPIANQPEPPAEG